MFNNKKYTYVDESIEEGYIKYSLLDYENNDAVIKVISVTMNTLSWVLNTKSGIATKKVDSLNDLKLICGEKFTKSCTGYVDNTAVMAITELKLFKINGTG